MDRDAEITRLRGTVARLRRSRTLLLRLLEESLREQESLRQCLAAEARLSNVRQLPPRSAQDRGSVP